MKHAKEIASEQTHIFEGAKESMNEQDQKIVEQIKGEEKDMCQKYSSANK